MKYMINKKNILLILLSLCCSYVLLAEGDNRNQEVIESERPVITDEFVIGIGIGYSFPNQKGLVLNNGTAPISYDESPIPNSFIPIADDTGREIGSSIGRPVIAASGAYSIKIPLLAGQSGFTSGNNLEIENILSLNPVAIGLDVKAKLTILPFLTLLGGSHIGTGWQLGSLGQGVGLNNNSSGEPDAGSFQGIVYKGSLGAKIKFDLAAVLSEPNEWSHIIFSGKAQFLYQCYSGASSNDAWIYGSSENFNGWKFKTSWFLGYEIPNFPLSMIGVGLSTNTNIGRVRNLDTIDNRGWGSDFVFTTIKAVTVWSIAENHQIQFTGLWGNGRVYTQDSIYYNYFQNREATGDSYWCFKGLQLGYLITF